MSEYRAEGGLMEQANCRIAQLEQENKMLLELAENRLDELEEHSNHKRQLAEAWEVIQGAWDQFAYAGRKGKHSGGLSALEYIESWLAANPEEKSHRCKHGVVVPCSVEECAYCHEEEPDES